MVINDSDPSTPQLIGLSGTGTSNVSLSPTSITFPIDGGGRDQREHEDHADQQHGGIDHTEQPGAITVDRTILECQHHNLYKQPGNGGNRNLCD